MIKCHPNTSTQRPRWEVLTSVSLLLEKWPILLVLVKLMVTSIEKHSGCTKWICHTQLSQSPFTTLFSFRQHTSFCLAYSLTNPTHRKSGENITEKENQTHHQFRQGDSDYHRPSANEDIGHQRQKREKEKGRKKKALYMWWFYSPWQDTSWQCMAMDVLL